MAEHEQPKSRAEHEADRQRLDGEIQRLRDQRDAQKRILDDPAAQEEEKKQAQGEHDHAKEELEEKRRERDEAERKLRERSEGQSTEEQAGNPPTQEEKERDIGVYHHKINEGGMEDILQNQRLRSSQARIMFGGGEGVRAYEGPYSPPPDATGSLYHSKDATFIEFRAERPPDNVNVSGTVSWDIPSGEYLQVEVTKVHRDGMVAEGPRSEMEMEEFFSKQEKQDNAAAEKRPQRKQSMSL